MATYNYPETDADSAVNAGIIAAAGGTEALAFPNLKQQGNLNKVLIMNRSTADIEIQLDFSTSGGKRLQAQAGGYIGIQPDENIFFHNAVNIKNIHAANTIAAGEVYVRVARALPVLNGV